MIVLDYSDTRPIYEQIVEKLQTYILKGVLKPDEQLMSVRQLAMDLSINPNTIQKAYSELERRGFIYVVKGRGAFVKFDDSQLVVQKENLAKRVQEIFREAEELGIQRNDLLETVDSLEMSRKIEEAAYDSMRASK
ncbi:MAG: GntR family transcriptional regulator [Lachnospiraceae bacterium]|nr:GntR family transcriptional regulator [Lachnospiraceae bacterium]